MAALFTKAGGMSALVNQFQTDKEPHGTEIPKTTVQIWEVRYLQCGRLFFTAEGFFLLIKYTFQSYLAIFIRWGLIRGECRKSSLFGRTALELEKTKRLKQISRDGLRSSSCNTVD
jgi:hypothetical protein